jgi:hypothetical protein
MMAKHKLRVGFVGLSLPAYFGERLGYRERTIQGLAEAGSRLGF